MDFTLDYASLAKKLECQELESPAHQASAQVYGQLLAIYLLFNDLTSAKFLWKRIPDKTKKENHELSLIWNVGKLMWKKNYAEIYRTINSCPAWPNHLKNIMKLILQSTRQRVIELISRAYSSIHVSDASKLLGLSESETLQLIESQSNWSLESESNHIKVESKEAISPSMQHSNGNTQSGTELLKKLTDYITFLESSK